MNSNDNRNDNIQKIIDNSDIVSVISNYIPLEKKGNDYKGLCPFHNDSNPSLSVSPSKKVFKCFSCNTAGNVIQFVQKYENISFVEAMKKVAQLSGIELNIRENPVVARNRKYYKIMDEVTNAYEFYLKNTNEGEKALEYLKKRNINEDVINHFHIGLSSHEGNLIVKTQVETNRILPLDLQEVGLIGMNNNDKHYYDLFRGRIMFPLKDLQGNIVGFSGRIYDMESNSKYMNSQENIIFKKSNILYNYSDAVNIIKQKNHVIVFEGFMDVIAAYKAGVNNTLATMGTALTEEQIKIILKLTNNVTLCYDGDGPGIEATKRAIRLFSKYGVIVKTVMLEEGLDPDDYLNKYGKDATYDLLVNKNISSVDYLYNIEKRNLNVNDSTSITSFEKNIYKLVDYFKSNALKNYLFNLMSKDLKMSLDDINDDYNNLDLIDSGKDNIKDIEILDIPEDHIYQDDNYDYDDLPVDVPYENKQIATIKSHPKHRYITSEEGLVYLAFKDIENCKYIKRKLGLDEYVDKINRELLWMIYDYYALHQVMNQEEFFSKLDSFKLDRMNAIINSPNIYMHDSIDNFIANVKECKYERASNDLKEQIISGNGDAKTWEELMKCRNKTIKIKKEGNK